MTPESTLGSAIMRGNSRVTVLARLPMPTSQSWEWQTAAACRGMSSASFFHPWGARGTARVDLERRAKQICAECPVIDACRRHALEVQEPYGVWGGLSEDERLVLLNRQRRRRTVTGRPTQ